MKKGLIFALTGLAMIGFGALAPKKADAQSLTWYVQSYYEYQVDVAFYSQDRNHEWPGGGDVWVLDDYNEQEIALSCIPGETICYGAWVRGDSSTYWGVGYNNEQWCGDCCYVCDGGYTPTIVLEP